MTDYSSHTFTTLSQTLHRIFQQVSTHLHQVSTSFNKMNEYRFSFTAYSTTFIHIHFNKLWYNSLSILQQHTSSRIYISFLNISSSYLQQTFNELLQSILRNKLSDVLFITNIQRIFLRNDLAHYSSHSFQQIMIQFFINIHHKHSQ